MIVKEQIPTLEINCKQARPFLKWAGGKSQLLGQFEKYYPVELIEKFIIKAGIGRSKKIVQSNGYQEQYILPFYYDLCKHETI